MVRAQQESASEVTVGEGFTQFINERLSAGAKLAGEKHTIPDFMNNVHQRKSELSSFNHVKLMNGVPYDPESVCARENIPPDVNDCATSDVRT